MKGLTYAAPAFAAIRHCTLEKHNVTLVLMPASARRRTAIMPASSIGIFTTMLSAILASSFPSRTIRSEEHTSELQSRLHLVCRLLLEKKKKNNKQNTSIVTTNSD